MPSPTGAGPSRNAKDTHASANLNQADDQKSSAAPTRAQLTIRWYLLRNTTPFWETSFPLSTSDKNIIFELRGYRRVRIWNFRPQISFFFMFFFIYFFHKFLEKNLKIFQNVEIFEIFEIFLKFSRLWRIFDQNNIK